MLSICIVCGKELHQKVSKCPKCGVVIMPSTNLDETLTETQSDSEIEIEDGQERKIAILSSDIPDEKNEDLKLKKKLMDPKAKIEVERTERKTSEDSSVGQNTENCMLEETQNLMDIEIELSSEGSLIEPRTSDLNPRPSAIRPELLAMSLRKSHLAPAHPQQGKRLSFVSDFFARKSTSFHGSEKRVSFISSVRGALGAEQRKIKPDAEETKAYRRPSVLQTLDFSIAGGQTTAILLQGTDPFGTIEKHKHYGCMQFNYIQRLRVILHTLILAHDPFDPSMFECVNDRAQDESADECHLDDPLLYLFTFIILIIFGPILNIVYLFYIIIVRDQITFTIPLYIFHFFLFILILPLSFISWVWTILLGLFALPFSSRWEIWLGLRDYSRCLCCEGL